MTTTTAPQAPPERPGSRRAYDGTSPFPEGRPGPRTGAQRLQMVLTGAIVAFPLLAVVLAGWVLWGRLFGPADLLIALVFYVVTGLGVTAGFHRGLTHRSFTAIRPLRLVLAVAGSMSFQGDVIGWVATHRRHHAFTDRPGDPHSPFRYGTTLRGQLRGLAHAHVGWLFHRETSATVPAGRYAPDLLADRGLRAVSRAFPAWCALSLALPFAIGWGVGGTLHGALTALLWAGLVRVALLQHVTWSVNSLCHMVGTRPFRTRRHDRATNLWPLALLSFGESWHNLHHADPTCARHGVDRGQLDPTAAAIRLFERLGWATDVRWPTPARLDHRRR
ncbi:MULTISPECIES: acyl-CoA desaturase [Streptomyces]|nr:MULTISPECIES: fatty acid desaturase [Streptomyces]KOG52447.1 stearoyl-CoA 9-desaturase [Streptomyces griseoflavus]KOG75005.1 stearoyl-CoA 9-desaturase [Kitasatospora aureofaciens]KUJ40356.1 stearoyl-CoA 9-desaturase [Streptomyces rimosus subsp. rimosus]UNZ01064.1 Fatty acid desaturase [Streptomyces rimosus subsp. rimosus]UTH93045.1 Fatty acid desaturase [Streptomyces rimosus subsp. rimosus]